MTWALAARPESLPVLAPVCSEVVWLGGLARWSGSVVVWPVFPDEEAEPPELLAVEVPP